MTDTLTPTATANAARSAALRGMAGTMTWDVGLALGSYYGARAAGLSEYAALLAGTVAAAGRIGWVLVRDRRLDAFAGFLVLMFAAGTALTFLTGDARLMLAKDSATDALAGLVFLGSVLLGRPLAYTAAQRFAGPAGAPALRARAATDPALRRRFRTISLVWGSGLLGESLLRLPLVYLLPLDAAVGASKVLMVAMYGALIGWTVRSGRSS
jgi:hypothetical protein